MPLIEVKVCHRHPGLLATFGAAPARFDSSGSGGMPE